MAVPKWARENMAKTGGQPTFGVVSKPSLFHSSPVKLADGGDPTEAELKRMGLEASNRYAEIEKSQEQGFLDRLKGEGRRLFDRIAAGNIDAPGSRAYEQYGAGLGRKEYEANQAREQSIADTERARKEYKPETASEIASRMGRVEGLSSSAKPAQDTPQANTSTDTNTNKEITAADWDAFVQQEDARAKTTTTATNNNNQTQTNTNSNTSTNTSTNTNNNTAASSDNKKSRKRNTRKSKSSSSNQLPDRLAITTAIPSMSQQDRQQQADRNAPANNSSLSSRRGARGGDNENRPSKQYPINVQTNSQSQNAATETGSRQTTTTTQQNSKSAAEARKAKLDQAEALRQQYFIARNVYNKYKTEANKKKYQDLLDQYRAIEAELRKK